MIEGAYYFCSMLNKSNYCRQVVEKIWETVARCRRPRATVSQIFSTTEGQYFDCSPSSLEITVLLPNCFKSPKTVNSMPMLVFDVMAFDVSWRHLSRGQSTVLCWPANSLFCCPLTKKLVTWQMTSRNVKCPDGLWQQFSRYSPLIGTIIWLFPA